MQRHIAGILLVVVLALLGMSVIMLMSTGARYVTTDEAKAYTTLYRQIMWMGMGAAACILLARTDYHSVVRQGPWILGAAVLLLFLVFVPGLGKHVNGSTRWISLGGFNFQPSEYAKLALVLFLTWWLTKYQRQAGTFLFGIAVPALATALLVGLTVVQPDLGVTVVLGVLFMVVSFCGGARKRYLLPIPLLGAAGIATLVFRMPERMGRLLAFLDPHKYRADEAYQPWQALIALGSGGPEGLGLGMSRQKHSFLPESDTDFIFPILGEELGLWVALGVVVAFLILTLASGWITVHAPDPTGVYLGIGLTTMISIQAIVNFMVVTSMMPTKGMPLPFISYGGSNLVLCMSAMGILFNIARQGVVLIENPEEQLLQRCSLRM
jgi:cell division protein FtsW